MNISATSKTKTITLLLIGRILTNVGDSLIYMSVLWYFNSRYPSTLFVTLIFVITSGVDALSFLLGPILDRVRVKSLLVTATVSQLLLALGLVLGMLTHLNAYLLGSFLLLFLLLSTICSALIYPTENKLLPLLASGAKLLHVNGLFQLNYQALDLVLNGAVLGLLSVLSVKTTLALAVPVFGIALLAFRALKITSSDTSDHSDTNYRQALWTGWQTLRRHPFMLRALIPFAALNFFYGAVDTSLPRLSKVYLSGQAWGYGALLTGMSIGGLLGALAVQKLTITGKKLIQFAGLCMLASGVCRLALLASQNPFFMVGILSLSSFWISMMNVSFIAFVQSAFDADVLGRISTINESLISIMIPFGSALGGLLVAHFNPILPELICGGMTLICGTYFLQVLFHRLPQD